MRRSFRIASIAALTAAAFAAGVKLAPRLEAEPLYTAYAKYVLGLPSHKQQLEAGVIQDVMTTDYAKVIQLAGPEDAAAKRAAMAAYLFRGEPAGMARRPDGVERDVLFPPLADLDLAGIDVLTVAMPWEVVSKVYYLHAAKPASCLMIYQEGHRVSFLERKSFLDQLVSQGCDVLALSLPLTGGMNPRPIVDHPRLGRMLLNDPDDLQLLNSRNYSSLAYFLMPLVAGLNHALDEQSYARVGATGFSGGGWAVQVFSAIEPRIQATYSVAGSVPANVHVAKPEWGSPEQRQGTFYEIVNYSELYVLAADQPGRRHVQVYNETDPCCFAGRNWMAWYGAVGERIRQFGGDYLLLTYEAAEHTMTRPVAQTIIDDFLNRGGKMPAGVTAY